MLTIYGIKNCDNVKQAKKYFDAKGIAWHYHDFRLDGVDKDWLKGVLDRVEWETVVNKRGTTYRHLPDELKQNLSEDNVLEMLIEYPTMIKRPVLQFGDELILGFFPKKLDKMF